MELRLHFTLLVTYSVNYHVPYQILGVLYNMSADDEGDEFELQASLVSR
jgi:hypothetical protein